MDCLHRLVSPSALSGKRVIKIKGVAEGWGVGREWSQHTVTCRGDNHFVWPKLPLVPFGKQTWLCVLLTSNTAKSGSYWTTWLEGISNYWVPLSPFSPNLLHSTCHLLIPLVCDLGSTKGLRPNALDAETEYTKPLLIIRKEARGLSCRLSSSELTHLSPGRLILCHKWDKRASRCHSGTSCLSGNLSSKWSLCHCGMFWGVLSWTPAVSYVHPC